MNDPTQPPATHFPFPADKSETIDRALKSSGSAGEYKPLQSVRPERQKVVVPRDMTDPGQAPKMEPVIQSSPTPMAEAEGISIDLPSRFHYYPFKDLYIKPFRVPHLAKLAKVDATSNLQLFSEVVSSVLSTPTGEQGLGFQLTVNDFKYVLFWLRMNSFSKQTMTVTSRCGNEKHVKMVEAAELEPETLVISTTFSHPEVAVRYLDNAPDREHYSVMYGDTKLYMRPESMLAAAEFLEHPKMDDEEFQYLARVATVIDFDAVFETRLSLDEKIEIVSMLMPEDTIKALEFADLVDQSYGLDQTVKTTCKKCGASGVASLHLDAQTFLTPSF